MFVSTYLSILFIATIEPFRGNLHIQISGCVTMILNESGPWLVFHVSKSTGSTGFSLIEEQIVNLKNTPVVRTSVSQTGAF